MNNDTNFYRYLFKFLNFKEKLNFKKVCNKFCEFYIFKLIDDTYSREINQQILEQKTYKFIVELYVTSNKK